MKVVLFCGGLGTRLREHSETIPKPLVTIGYRPVLWHLMRFYAHFGHREFILALGYRGDMIREYFTNYKEYMSHDFTLSMRTGKIDLAAPHVDDWRITFVDTGLHSNIGQRLLRIRRYVEGEPVFLANYADALSDVPLDRQLAEFQRDGFTASFAAVRARQSFHAVRHDESGLVTSIGPIASADLRLNGGFFCLRPEIFDVIEDGDDLVEQPFQRLIQQRKLYAFKHDGFWQPMDTLKDKIILDRMEAREDCPWAVWQLGGAALPKPDSAAQGAPFRARRHLAVGGHTTAQDTLGTDRGARPLSVGSVATLSGRPKR